MLHQHHRRRRRLHKRVCESAVLQAFARAIAPYQSQCALTHSLCLPCRPCCCCRPCNQTATMKLPAPPSRCCCWQRRPPLLRLWSAPSARMVSLTGLRAPAVRGGTSGATRARTMAATRGTAEPSVKALQRSPGWCRGTLCSLTSSGATPPTEGRSQPRYGILLR